MLTNTLSSNLSLTSIVLKDNKVSENPQPKTRLKPSDTNASSVISHPKLPLVILRTDYLALAHNNHCAAKLLAILENWTNWFVRQGKFDHWVRLPTEALSQHLLGEHNKAVIQKAITLLVSCGFIRREQRRKHRHDRSWFYWFDIERTQEAINALEPPIEPESESDLLELEASLEPETPVVVDPPELVNPREEPETSAALDPPEMVNPVENNHFSLLEEAETRVVIEPPEMVNRIATNSQSSSQKQSIDKPEMVDLLIGISNKDLNSSNINIPAAAFKTLEEKEKSNQGRTNLQTPAPLIEEPKSRAQPIATHDDKSSAAAAPLVALKAVLPPIAPPTEGLSQLVQPTTLEQVRPTVVLMDERDAINGLRKLGIERNESVLALIKKLEAAVPDALGYIQQLASRENIKNITGAFVNALKEGKKPVDLEPSFGLHLEVNPPTEQQLQALEDARSKQLILDYFFSSIDNTHKVILNDGLTQVLWWEYLASLQETCP